jgi:hypothetical protein
LSPLGNGSLSWLSGWDNAGGAGGVGGAGGWWNCGAWWGSATGSLPYCWTWDDVGRGGIGVDLNGNTWVAHLEGTWEGDQVGGVWKGAAGTGDGELSALWVELWSAGLVKSENLVADEVVTWLEGSWDGGGPLEGIEDDTVAPLALVDGSGKETGLSR